MDSTPLYQKMTASGSSTPPLSSPMMSPDALKRRSDNNAGDATVKAFIADDDDAIDADFHRKSVIFEHPFDGSPLINFEKNELENTRADLTAAIITSSDEETKDTLHRKDDEPMEDHVDRPYYIYSDEPILLNREDLNEITTEEPPMTELFEEIVYPSPQSGLIDVPSDQIKLPPLPYEIEAEGVYDWYINDWQSLSSLQKVFSPSFSIGGKSNWRILMFPRGSSGHEANVMSLFLDNIDVKKESVGGAVCAQFSIGIYNVHDPKINYSKDAHHRFNAKETDWGFTKYVPLTDLRELLPMSPSVVTKQQLLGSGGVGGELKPKLVENNRFLIRVHVRMIKDVSGTLWLNHDTFDSRREIGYVGIKNQGATCYMNSLLQSLFMMTSFKKMLFGIPTEHQEIHRNIPLVLQKFFYNLHVSPTAVSTKELTSSFGWDSYESFVQQDIQELKALLFDSLEAKLKGTPHEKDLDNLFQVSSMRFIKCLNVDYESKSYSTFYDIPLEIKGLPSVEASFKKYIETETLEGNNQYKSETYGYQDAVTGNVFTRFPPILYLNLKRYEYDFMEDRICKVNDYYEFPESINLSPYYSPADAQRDLSQERPENQQYKLFGILVHSGDFGGGHYYSFLKDFAKDLWIRFDDDRVHYVDKEEAIFDNYGDSSLLEPSELKAKLLTRSESKTSLITKPPLTGLAARIKKFTSAYMLIYIREKDIPWVLAPFSIDNDIPSSLMTLCENEKLFMEERRRQRILDLNQQRVYVVTDDYIKDNEGHGIIESYFLTPQERSLRTKIRRAQNLPDLEMLLPKLDMEKTHTVTDLKVKLEEGQGLAKEHQRFWLIRKKHSQRRVTDPIVGLKMETKIFLKDFTDKNGELTLYLEIGLPDKPLPRLSDDSVLLFIKKYNSLNRQLEYCGSVVMNGKYSLLGNGVDSENYLSILRILGISFEASQHSVFRERSVKIYEEARADELLQLTPTTLYKTPIKDTTLSIGDILVFEIPEADTVVQGHVSVSAPDYFKWLFRRVIITFKLNQSSDYNEVINNVLAKRLQSKTKYIAEEEFKSNDKFKSENIIMEEVEEEEGGIFHLELSKDMTYEQVSEALYRALLQEFPVLTSDDPPVIIGPSYLAFRMYEPILNTCKSTMIPYNLALTLDEMLPKTHYLSASTVLYYEILDMSLPLLELKKPLRVQYISKVTNQLSSKLLLLDEGDVLGNILEKFQAKLPSSCCSLRDEVRSPVIADQPSGHYRILEISALQCWIQQEYIKLDEPLVVSPVASNGYYEAPLYHLEEIPMEEWNILSGSSSGLIIRCFSFQKDLQHCHGFPFTFVLGRHEVMPEESLLLMKSRLRARVQDALPSSHQFSEKEWEKVQLASVSMLRPLAYMKDPISIPTKLFPWNLKTDHLGLDCINKAIVQQPTEKSLKLK